MQALVMESPAPAYILLEDTGLFRIPEPGWYAIDDDHKAAHSAHANGA
jgi:hypothetical protein